MGFFSQKYIGSQKQFSLYLQYLYGDFHLIPCHYIWFIPSGINFHCIKVFPPNIDGVINVMHRYRAVFYLMALNSPSEILRGQADKCFVELSCDLPVIDLSLCEMFHVFGDSSDKSELFPPSIEVMKSVFIYTELHVTSVSRWKMDIFSSLLYAAKY